VREVFVWGPDGLAAAPRSPSPEVWSAGASGELAELHRLEAVERNEPAALAECRRLLSASTDDAVILEALLGAARLSAGSAEESERYLRIALERFGGAVDPTGMPLDVAILTRIAEIQRERGGDPRLRETLRALRNALDARAGSMEPESRAFFEKKLESLAGDLPSLAGDALVPASREESPAAAPFTPEEIAKLGAAIAGQAPRAGDRGREAHVALPGRGDLDLASFAAGSGLTVHLLLDRERFLDDARMLALECGIDSASLAFRAAGPGQNPGQVSGLPRAVEEMLTVALPPPFRNMAATYIPPSGTFPEAFRGFDAISLATFTWAVIVLVLAIVVGAYITLRSVLREMRTARIKSDFVSFISHELKTPLTSIRMFTETLLAGRVDDEEESRFCISMIDKESERLSKLIDQVLEFSRIEKHQKEFRFASCNMEDIVKEAVKLFQAHSRADPREVEVNAVQRISKIKMDRAAMVELFLNLLSNAAKYSTRGKKITVNLRESIDDISVEVVDQGVGIRKRDQKKIFDKFFRAEDYLTREVEGTGLGLTFARYIAKVHNGDIRVSSQPQTGSTFTVHLRKSQVLAE
jgi:signal transduction histidine kinase